MASSSTTDRIEKRILLRSPRARVWRALTDTGEFGRWFGVELTGTFAPGARMQGRITEPGYENIVLELVVERMEPERLFSWRWHPHAVEPAVDYSSEPTTLVVFELESRPEGTLLTVVESGFDQLPPARRALAYRMNDKGWADEMAKIEKHVASTP